MREQIRLPECCRDFSPISRSQNCSKTSQSTNPDNPIDLIIAVSRCFFKIIPGVPGYIVVLYTFQINTPDIIVLYEIPGYTRYRERQSDYFQKKPVLDLSSRTLLLSHHSLLVFHLTRWLYLHYRLYIPLVRQNIIILPSGFVQK